MANSPVDRNQKIMMEEFGTRCLITDVSADKYISRAKREEKGQKKFSDFCGGKEGWDDFTERWH